MLLLIDTRTIAGKVWRQLTMMKAVRGAGMMRLGWKGSLFFHLLPGANTRDPTHDKVMREKT